MQIIRVDEFGEPDVLKLIELPDPVPEAGQILISVKACGINYADVIGRAGNYVGVPSVPYFPGLEVAGTVEAVGDEVSGYSTGDRVMAFVPDRGYASKAVVDAKIVAPIPDGLDFGEATTLLVQGLTAHFLLKHGEMAAGKTVLISSASGGLGSLAVQFAKLQGAKKVIGLSSKGKFDRVKSLGADDVVDYRQVGWSHDVLKATGDAGVDLYLDSGGDFAGEGFDTLGSGSHWMVYGGMSNTGKPLPADRLGPMMVKSITLRGYSLYYDMANIGDELPSILELGGAGRLTLDVEYFPLKEAPAAHQAISDRKTSGKVVLVP